MFWVFRKQHNDQKYQHDVHMKIMDVHIKSVVKLDNLIWHLMQYIVRYGIVRGRASTAPRRFSPYCGRICVNSYVEAKNFGFIHELWTHPLIIAL